MFRTLGNQSRAAASLNNIGNIYYDQSDLVHARQYYEQTIAAYREIDDKSGLAGGLGNLANVLDGMGDLPGSLKMQRAGLAAFREIGDQRGTASTLSNLGNLLAEMGDLENAPGNLQRSTAGRQSDRVQARNGLRTLRTSRRVDAAWRFGARTREGRRGSDHSPRSGRTA